MSGIAALRARIAAGSATAEELLPLLTCERPAERARNAAELARDFAAAGDMRRASVFSKRAFVLSGHAEEFLAEYLEVHRALNDTDAIHRGHTLAGLRHAQNGNIES